MSNEENTIPDLTEKIKILEDAYKDIYKKYLIYKKILSSSTDGFLVVDCDGLIFDINKSYAKYLGLDIEEVVGKPILSVISNSKMLTILKEKLTDIDAMHTLPDNLVPSGEKMVCVSRMPVIDGNETLAAVATIRFSQHTISLAKTLQRLEGEVSYYRSRLGRYGPDSFDDLCSKNVSYSETVRMARRFAGSDLPILLLGETGVGKDVFANAIHLSSSRVGKPFVCVNCASIPGELLESELFGYVEGAFTGSKRGGKKGKFEIANGGTLFFDEIGEMPIQMQSKLLRILQDQEVEKLGSEKTIHVDVRIVAATNVDLFRSIESGKFRSDLYYRLNALTITIPPLREHVEDIPDMCENILKKLINTYGATATLSAEAMDSIQNYSWPGNIRELHNAIGRGFMLAENGVILPEHLPSVITEQKKNRDADETMQACVDKTQWRLVLNSLTRHRGNFSRAAQELGVHRTTLYSHVRSMGMSVQELRSKLSKAS